MCTPCDKNFSHGTIIFYLVTLTLKFDLLSKKFNLGYFFQTRRDTCRVFILHNPCDKTFHKDLSHHVSIICDLDLNV